MTIRGLRRLRCGQEAHARARHLRDGAFDSFADIVELQVEKDVFAEREQLTDEVHTGGGVEFHAHFVEARGRTDAIDESAGFGGGFDVECDDDGVMGQVSPPSVV